MFLTSLWCRATGQPDDSTPIIGESMSRAFRILVVADEPSIHDRLRRLLNSPAHQIHAVPSGRSAMAFLARHRVDLVLVRVVEAGAGEDFVERQKKRWPDTLIIVISDYASTERKRVSSRRSAYDYLMGQAGDGELARSVRNALNHKKLRDELNEARQALKLERQQLLSIFDSVDHPVYVTALDSYEVLYANQTLRKKFGRFRGKKCYTIFQGNDSPCSCCTSGDILEKRVGRRHISEFQNRINDR